MSRITPGKMYRATVVVLCLTLVSISGCERSESEITYDDPSLIIEFDYSNDEMFEFEIEDYLQNNAAHLSPYAEIVSHWAAKERISPRFLIALIEQQSGAVSKPESDVSKPFGDLSKESGFLEQTRDVAIRLRSIAVPGDMRIKIDAPHDAILTLLSAADIKELGEAYQRLFPGVMSQPKRAIRAESQIPLQFPYPIGSRWYFGGTHSDSGSGSIMSSLDFMMRGDGWGDNIEEYVVASAPGKVKRHSSCYVSIVHDSGWSTGYYHLDNVVVKTGDNVQANQAIAKYANNRAQSLCMGGSSSGPHVHWTLMHSNREYSLSGVALSGWAVHPGKFNYDENCSNMYVTREGKKTCPWTLLVNDGASEQEDCAGKCSPSCRCGEGQGKCNTDLDCKQGLFCEQQSGADICLPDPNTIPRVEMSKATYSVNEKIVINFYNLPGFTTDWVGTYKSGTNNQQYLGWAYTGGAKNGAIELPGLTAGKYEARLFLNDSYNLEHKVSFTVKTQVVDNCPGDPTKTEPGECGCGIPEGTCQPEDNCPDDPTKTEPGECGCGIPEGTCQPEDNCPDDPTKTEPGECGCGVPEGTCQPEDNCPDDPTKTEPGECGCGVPEGTCQNKPSIELPKKVYSVNEKIVVHFNGLPGNAFDWIGTYRSGANNNAYLGWKYTDGVRDGTLELPGLPAGQYEARLFFSDSYNLEHTVSFTVKTQVVDNCPNDPNKTEPGECGCGVPEGTCQPEPYIELPKETFAVNEKIVVRFYNLPGNSWDWVGTYRANGSNYDHINWKFTNGAVSGVLELPGLGVGNYEARLFFNDSYTREQTVFFSVN